MDISKEEITYIANLASIKIKDEEIQEYIKNLQDILNFANIVSKVEKDNLENQQDKIENYNNFRKDEIRTFENTDALIQNAPEKEDNMFKIPNVI